MLPCNRLCQPYKNYTTKRRQRNFAWKERALSVMSIKISNYLIRQALVGTSPGHDLDRSLLILEMAFRFVCLLLSMRVMAFPPAEAPAVVHFSSLAALTYNGFMRVVFKLFILKFTCLLHAGVPWYVFNHSLLIIVYCLSDLHCSYCIILLELNKRAST